MQNKPIFTKQEFLEAIKPYYLFSSLMMYILGISLLSYFNLPASWPVAIWGYLIVLFCQLIEGVGTLAMRKKPGIPSKSLRVKENLLWIIIAFLMLGIAVILVFLINNRSLSAGTWISIALLFLISIFSTQERFTVVNEFFGAFIVTGIIPALSFSLFSTELHRFLILINLPLFFIFLATMISLSFPNYARDLSLSRNSFLTVVGWQNGVILHDLFLIAGFLCLGISGLIGLPWVILCPTMLSGIFAIFQIVVLHRIAGGHKPNWRLLKFTAIGVFLLSAYTMMLSLLIN